MSKLPPLLRLLIASALVIVTHASLTAVASQGAFATRANIVSGEQLIDVARAALADRYPQYSGQWTLTPLNLPSSYAMNTGVVALVAQPLALRPLRQRMNVQVAILIDQHAVRSVQVSFDVSVPLRTATYQQNYPAKTDVAQISTAEASVNLATVTGGVESLMAELPNTSRLRRNVRAGDAVRKDDFSRTPEVKKNEEVNVTIESKGIRIVAQGQAMADAYIGQQVRVRVGTASFSSTVTAIQEVTGYAR
jgi:flagella basal body P-ring formation protein FlgA